MNDLFYFDATHRIYLNELHTQSVRKISFFVKKWSRFSARLSFIYVISWRFILVVMGPYRLCCWWSSDCGWSLDCGRTFVGLDIVDARWTVVGLSTVVGLGAVAGFSHSSTASAALRSWLVSSGRSVRADGMFRVCVYMVLGK